jgi:alkaline phosphatase
MNKLFFFFCLVICGSVFAQPRHYTTANAHSHNDYEKPLPFHEAYNHQFGSIEADIFLMEGYSDLFVAHTRADLNKKKLTLDSMYLLPLVNCIRKNKGFVYSDTTLKLQLLIDIKSEAIATLNQLITVLRQYPELVSTPSLQIAISGNRPPIDSFISYPSFIYFDGVPGSVYNETVLSRVLLFSASFRGLSRWDGKGRIPDADKTKLIEAINTSHISGKPIRFWAAPDTIDAWKELINLKVDYINTDRIADLSRFLKTLK